VKLSRLRRPKAAALTTASASGAPAAFSAALLKRCLARGAFRSLPPFATPEKAHLPGESLFSKKFDGYAVDWMKTTSVKSNLGAA
jgi:hypothetical protein